MDAAQAATHVGCVGPMGGRIEVPGRLAVVPRRVLDDILKRAAERAGARFHAPWRFESLLLDGDRVTGAVLQRPPSGGAAAMITEVRARWTILATGAQPRALIAAEMCDRQTPTGVALRGYIRHPGLGRRHALDVIWNRKMRQGYGWMFPLPDGVWNIGVGVAQSHRQLASGKGRMADVNLREMFDAFTRVYAPAGELVRGGEWVAPLKGAPLRCSLEGARYGRPGLMVTGEAAGSTYAFTGEGIGKAMETGIMAAEAMLAAQAAGEPEGRARERYEAELATLKPRYDLYARASRVNAHPWLADLLIWRASRSPHILRRMAGVLEETTNPGGLVSARGIAKLFLPAG
jgi:flavin-dependent dehydrogenase